MSALLPKNCMCMQRQGAQGGGNIGRRFDSGGLCLTQSMAAHTFDCHLQGRELAETEHLAWFWIIWPPRNPIQREPGAATAARRSRGQS